MLTPWLNDKIRSGDAILFLGAGAVRSSASNSCRRPPNGSELRDLIADKFLGGAHRDKPLARVAEYAKSESSLREVQRFIRSVFEPIEPPPHYSIIPAFRWFSIVTTNYDLTLERAYANYHGAIQNLQPIIKDGQRLAEVLRDDRAVPYLKLHGSISEIGDPGLPLILATEEYAKHKKNRERLFQTFQDWAKERPLIFAGYDISDPNIVQILFDLSDMGTNRPTYAVVDPALDAIAMRYWASKRFVPISDSFENFLAGLDAAIPAHSRILSSLRTMHAVSYQKWIAVHDSPSNRLQNYISTELTHVHPARPMQGVSPKDFYSGNSSGWGPVADNLIVRRRAGEDIILDSVLSQPSDVQPRVFLLKGHAGVGISVALRQISWEAARDFEALVVYVNEGGLIRPDLLEELAGLVRTRFLLVVDDAIPHLKDVASLISRAKARHFPLDILLAARTNEWNVSGEGVLETSDYDLRDLNDSEIRELVSKLKQHNCLGELGKISEVQQIERFRQYAGRQLLVALHEATTGRPFEELILDEYSHITPERAKVLYLDICTLHRLGVSIRAGLVARVSGISFSDFSRELFKPLEHVVFTYEDYASRDIAYRTRHPVIAQFVFQQVLPDPVERAAQIRRIVRHMNVDYASDAEAFEQLVKGKTLAELFADKALAKEIFDAALEAGAPKGFINHQRAVFELNHPGGDLKAAMSAIREAESREGGSNYAVDHTKALILRKLALASQHQLEKGRFRNEAHQILLRLTRSARTPHALTAMVQLELDKLREMLEAQGAPEESGEDLEQRVVAESIRSVEQSIFTGMQQYPGDEYLLALDAQLSDLLQNYPKALKSLREAFEANQARPFIAVRLARFLDRSDDQPGAISVLERCLAANPSSKECHLELALLHMKSGEGPNSDTIGYHLKRGFTEGDTNHLAQFWWARHEFIYGDRVGALKRFERLSKAKIALQLRHRAIRPIVDDEGKARRFSGIVASSFPTYCFIRCGELQTDIFVTARSFQEADWDRMHRGAQVEFGIAFSARGPEGVNVTLA